VELDGTLLHFSIKPFEMVTLRVRFSNGKA
jgi:hypothetical protein